MNGQTRLLSDPLLWFVLGIGVFSGAMQNLLIITFPVFRRTFSARLEALGTMQGVVFGSALVFSLLSGWITLKVGLRRAVLLNLTLLALTLAAIGAAPDFAVVLVFASCLGFTLAGLEVFPNALIGSTFCDRRQIVYLLSGVSIAVGSGLGAAAIGKWLRDTEYLSWGWRAGYWGLAGIVFLFAIAGSLLPALKALSHEARSGSAAVATKEVITILHRWPIYLAGVAMFLHGLAQVGIVSWLGLLFQSRLSIDTAQAAYLLSANGTGFLLGRMLLSWITTRVHMPDLLLLAFCSGLGALAYFGTLTAHAYATGLVLFFLSGMIVCGNGPAMYSYIASQYPAVQSSAFGLILVFGYLGSVAGPFVIGVIGARLGIERAVWCIPLFSLCLCVLALVGYVAEIKRGNVRLRDISSMVKE
jgi:fucose permease